MDNFNNEQNSFSLAGKDANSQEPPLNITNLAFLSNEIMTNTKGSANANYRFLICTSVNFDEFKRVSITSTSTNIYYCIL